MADGVQQAFQHQCGLHVTFELGLGFQAALKQGEDLIRRFVPEETLRQALICGLGEARRTAQRDRQCVFEELDQQAQDQAGPAALMAIRCPRGSK